MSVSNNQNANETTFNTSFMSREVNTSTVGEVQLANTTNPDSGATVTNTQRAINELEDTTGMAGEGDATRKVYSSNNVVANGDNRKVAIGKVDAEFNPTTGHKHNGAAGEGPPVSRLTSDSALPATTGIVRLSNPDKVAWRNNGNSADISVGPNGSDEISTGGNAVETGDIFPSAHNTKDIGSASRSFNDVYAKNIRGFDSEISIIAPPSFGSNGGQITAISGDSTNADGGGILLSSGNSIFGNAGNIDISGGNADTLVGGNINLNPGAGVDGESAGKIYCVGRTVIDNGGALPGTNFPLTVVTNDHTTTTVNGILVTDSSGISSSGTFEAELSFDTDDTSPHYISFRNSNGESWIGAEGDADLQIGTTGPESVGIWTDDTKRIEVDGTTGEISVLSHKITNLLDPTNAQDAATKAYVDATLSQVPTVQKFLSGSGTYTTPANVTWINVRMVGGGGGGGGSGTTSGAAATDGTATTFGTTLLSAGGGLKGARDADGGAGGSSSLGTGPIGTALSGGYGGGSARQSALPLTTIVGGHGGGSMFSGGGFGGSAGGSGNGGNGVTNTGGGGGGGFASNTSSVYSGSGGGSGGLVDAIITAPAASYSYTVGTGGTGQAAGTSGNSGGNGADGYIEVIEHYR